MKSQCSQEGVLANYLMCGTEHLLIIAVNEWTSRASLQGHEPYMAAVRHGVEVQFTPGIDWSLESAIDPLTEQPIGFSCKSDGTTVIRLPQFDTMQIVLLKRSEKPNGGLPVSRPKLKEEPPPSIVCCQSPIVSLGVVRPESVHQVAVPIKSNSKKLLVLAATGVSDKESWPGTFSAPEVTISPNEEAVLSIKYIAPKADGESVTNIQFTSTELPDAVVPVYICAEIQNPATLSPTLVDFGMLTIGSMTDARRVKIGSSDPTARIGNITPGNVIIHNIQTAEDGKSFSFSLQPEETGRITSAINVEVLLDHGKETLHRSVQFTAESKQAVFTTPSRIATVISGKPKKYTLLVQHVDSQPIQITSLSHGDAIQSHFERKTYRATHKVELTLLPEIGNEKESRVSILGKTKAGDAFTLTVPVSAVSMSRDRKHETATATGAAQ